MSNLIERQSAIDEWKNDFKGYVNALNIPRDDYNGIMEYIDELPSAEPEWNNHTVACLLADMFDDPCACNYNDIDEWLPKKCEVIDSCPNPVGVACWEQFLKHRKENR